MDNHVASPTILAPAESRSRSHEVTTALRRKILSGVFDVGERLTDARVAAEMGVSRGPAREALQALDKEGLIQLTPYRGAVVTDVSEEELLEMLLPVRVQIEQFAFAKALPLEADQVGYLEQIVEAMGDASTAGDLDQIVELDLEFHRTVVKASNQRHSLQLWELIVPRIRAQFHRFAPHHRDLDDIVAEHRQLLTFIKEASLNRLLIALEAHIRSAAIEMIVAESTLNATTE